MSEMPKGGITAVAAGRGRSFAIDRTGAVWVWGWRPEPSCDEDHTLVLSLSTASRIGDLSNITTIAAGKSTTFALKDDGTVLTWIKALFSGIHGAHPRFDKKIRITGLEGIVALEATDDRCLLIREDGTAWLWKYAGVFSGKETARPSKIDPPGRPLQTSCKCKHWLILNDDGTVWACGCNQDGELGIGTYENQDTPVQVLELSDVTSIAAGWFHSLAITKDGTVWAWGDNYWGELGTGTNVQANRPTPVPGLTDVISITAGWSYSVALKDDGTVWAWGKNTSGQLGDGTVINRNVPVQVKHATSMVEVVATDEHVLALKDDGTVWAWGCNKNGQLGDGTTKNRPEPKQVDFMSGNAR